MKQASAVLSGFLAVILCFSFAVPVFASEEDTPAGIREEAEGLMLDGTHDAESPLSIASGEEWEYLLEVNRYRMKNGLIPLGMDEKAQRAADVRVREIVGDGFSHTRPDGTYAATALSDEGIDFDWRCEIIACGRQRDTAALALDIWVNSSTHNAVILRGYYKHTGIGFYYASSDWYLNYWEQLFYSSDACSYTDMSVQQSVVKCKKGTSADDLGVVIEMTCSKHGKSWLPLMKEFCTGYDPNTEGVQTVTVSCLGFTDTLTVLVGDVDTGSFDDVFTTDWFYNDVEACSTKGLIKGTGTREFSPYGYGTRGQVVQVLYRLAGEPKITAASPFTDVNNADEWYYNAVVWAAENDIAQGYGDDTFCPDEPVTREQFLVFLYRYAWLTETAGQVPTSFSTTFEDEGNISSWAMDAELWSCGIGLQKGSSDNSGKLWLNPQSTIRRNEMAAFLNRFSDN